MDPPVILRAKAVQSIASFARRVLDECLTSGEASGHARDGVADRPGHAGAGIGQPGRELHCAGENRLRLSQPCAQAPPGPGWSSRMAKRRPVRRRN